MMEGTGLGLSISQKFIHLMNGNITVESNAGEGCTFTFDIAIEPVTLADVKPGRLDRKVIGLEEDEPDYRILIVEDNFENRLYLSNLLKLVGFNVREATDGFAGIEEFKLWQPDLIFMDMRMPNLDGFEATQRIKSIAKVKIPKIIAVTASVFEDDREKVLSAGCDDFIRKPIRETDLFEAISKHLGVKFIFDEKIDSTLTPDYSINNKELTKESLSTLPKDLLRDLKKAAVNLDQDAIKELIERLHLEGHDHIADQLDSMVKDFSFSLIDDLIDF